MRIKDSVYFSRNLKFEQIDWSDKDNVIDAFQDRVKELYLKPTEQLDINKHPFATGVMCSAIIDLLTRIDSGKEEITKHDFKNWLASNIQDFAKSSSIKELQTLAMRFYIDFRCGLVHEGRIKKAAAFSYDLKRLVAEEDGIMVVNPGILFSKVKEVLEKYFEKIRNSQKEYDRLEKVLKRDFELDIKHAKETGRINQGALISQTSYIGTR